MPNIRRAFLAMMSIIVASITALTFTGTTLALSYSSCVEGPLAVNHWRGEAVTGGPRHGTSGTVIGRTLLMCSNPGAFEVDGTFYFSNVEPTNGSFRDIIQVGFGQGRSPSLLPGMHFITGFGRSNTTPGCAGLSNVDPIAHQAGSYDNTSHDYKVYHQNNVWNLLVGSTVKLSYPEADLCWSPARSSWFGETWDSGDQMGGTPSSRMGVTSLNYATAENGGFVYTSLLPAGSCNYNNAPPNWYQCDIPSSRSIELWTLDR